ncbi:MAG: Ribosomal RNA small subunit methyltransferase I [Syntrophorhabdus sp. PtaU1.Bin153]|nr:MAG: Ribosomal RNA small subunit methyltransferase I [Syntrophorhabdus sp. PtaU1.Bin153]
MEGVLYVVATPVGNMKDITFRAVEVLRDVDLVVAESRERALKLLSHLSIRKPIITINSYNEERKAGSIAQQLLSGKTCALITGAGTPCISDPGGFVVRACHEAGVDVRAVPGPSAVAGAISISGLYADRFLFYGFLPLKRGKKRKVLREFLSFPYPMVFFESPRKLIDTLECIREELGNRSAVVVKEMTKIHETVIRGPLDDVIGSVGTEEPKGEYLIIVDGKGRSE